MPYSSQFGDFVVNLIAYVILIEPHPVYNFMDFSCRCELIACVAGMLLFDLSVTL